MLFLLFFLAVAARCDDILVYQPLLMPSHATFMARLVEVMAGANYSLTVLVNRHRADFPHGCDKAHEIITVLPVEGVLSGLSPEMGWKVKATPTSQWQAMNYLSQANAKQCKALLNDKQALSKLQSRKFRVLVHEVFDMCGLVLMKLLNIEKHIIVSSTRQMDTVGYELGLTDPFCHAGILSDYGCSLGWKDVLRNAWFIESFLKFTDNQVYFYKDEIKSLDLPKPLRKLTRTASAVFINTHPLTDSWRPSLRNVFDIGGIALHEPKPLLPVCLRRDGEKQLQNLDDELKKWNKVVFVSFGTVVPSAFMPEDWKKNMATVIRSFPKVLFLWKYEKEDTFSAVKLPNVIMSDFFPQNDLLHSGLISLFITHGGQNSILEAASAGVSLIVIPQFGDQFRNAKAVHERKLGVVLEKNDLGNFKTMHNTIDKMLQKEKRLKNVSHLISADIAARAFVTKMEEVLQTGLTFNDGPEAWDSLKFIQSLWTMFCGVMALLILLICFRYYPLLIAATESVKKLLYNQEEQIQEESTQEQ